MEDKKIIELYWDRDESAIVETQKKYGNYCYSIAKGILRQREDAEEVTNDTYAGAWNCIPPHRPEILRNISWENHKAFVLKENPGKNGTETGLRGSRACTGRTGSMYAICEPGGTDYGRKRTGGNPERFSGKTAGNAAESIRMQILVF